MIKVDAVLVWKQKLWWFTLLACCGKANRWTCST